MGNISRRDFLKIVGVAGLGLAASGYFLKLFSKSDAIADQVESPKRYLREAVFYESLDQNTVRCLLCPHQCVLKDGQRSFCRVREPQAGKLYTLVHELACAVHIDPVEKKPIYHMLPGTAAFSIATAGCSLRCKFCQNWQISQNPPENTDNEILPSEKVVRLAKENNCRSIAYTYSEPTVFYEYMIDAARLAKKENIKNIYVTSGNINPEPLIELSKFIDAANIDLKGYSDKYLREVCSQRLEPLLEVIKIAQREGVWVEITNLVVPTLNDDMNMIKEMCIWIRENLGKDVPLHFSRFWPLYKLRDLPPTPLATLEQARNIALQEGLHYVYIGNVTNHESNHTYCPNCKKVLIKRLGYYILENHIFNSSCQYCNYKIAGVWET